MVITLTLKIYEHAKCNMDIPPAQPFMSFIWQNILAYFFLKYCFKIFTAYSLLSVFSCSLSPLAFVSLDQRIYST